MFLVMIVIFVIMVMKQCVKNTLKLICTLVGLSEEYVVPAWNVSHGGVLKISDSLSFEEAAMIEPLACCG